ncbi:unnamed protein product [Xylocopa violacea]|uniref:Uncharacterized protein n=1 Tax=Xylocopa violacea TaxID=135666 RepID=A0ABP1PGK7_XYLVO
MTLLTLCEPVSILPIPTISTHQFISAAMKESQIRQGGKTNVFVGAQDEQTLIYNESNRSKFDVKNKITGSNHILTAITSQQKLQTSENNKLDIYSKHHVVSFTSQQKLQTLENTKLDIYSRHHVVSFTSQQKLQTLENNKLDIYSRH